MTAKYPLNAAVAGSTIIDEATWNGNMALRDVEMVYSASLVTSKTGAGATENDVNSYDFCGRFTLTGVTALGYIELEIAADGTGADLTLEIRSGMDPATGDDGDLLKSITIPAEWLPATAAYTFIPVALDGLSAGSNYWWRIRKAGDGTNHFHLIGEASTDASFPTYYRAASSGNWTVTNAIHVKVYSRTMTDDELLAVIAGQAVAVCEYTSGSITSIKQFIPPLDTTDGGIRDEATITYDNYCVKRVEVA